MSYSKHINILLFIFSFLGWGLVIAIVSIPWNILSVFAPIIRLYIRADMILTILAIIAVVFFATIKQTSYYIALMLIIVNVLYLFLGSRILGMFFAGV